MIQDFTRPCYPKPAAALVPLVLEALERGYLQNEAEWIREVARTCELTIEAVQDFILYSRKELARLTEFPGSCLDYEMLIGRNRIGSEVSNSSRLPNDSGIRTAK